MSSTVFVNGVTLTDEDWFNDVNRLHYTILGDPATLAVTKVTLNATLAAEQASTSGTSIDFTGIPSGVKRITVMFKGVSTNGTDPLLIQLGDAGGIEASGYLCSSVTLTNAAGTGGSNYTTGFGFESGSAANVFHGALVLSLENASAFSWTANGQIARSNSATIALSAGSKSTSAELDRVRITTSNGTDAFDAGSIAISYE